MDRVIVKAALARVSEAIEDCENEADLDWLMLELAEVGEEIELRREELEAADFEDDYEDEDEEDYDDGDD